MDWKTIHGFAEEAALWSTLAINFWLIVLGVVYMALAHIDTPSGRIVRAGGLASILVTFSACLLADLGLIFYWVDVSPFIRWPAIVALTLGVTLHIRAIARVFNPRKTF